MHVEEELKILDVNPEEVRKKLLSLNAKLVWKGEMKSYYFDFEDSKLMKAGKVLRLREAYGKVKLTLKKSITKGETRRAEETEVEVSSFSSMKEVLEELGLKVAKVVENYREEYRLGNGVVELEHMEPIGWFVEIEASKERIFELIHLLGLERKKKTTKTKLELLGFHPP